MRVQMWVQMSYSICTSGSGRGASSTMDDPRSSVGGVMFSRLTKVTASGHILATPDYN
jgi:hypothetical protein